MDELSNKNSLRPYAPRFDGRSKPALIAPIVHQSWKVERPPLRWAHTIKTVKRHHPGWEYRLWSDASSMEYVRANHPRLFPIYAGFNREIMQCDVMRYVMMHDFGGVYCDLDYEYIRPYEYGDAQLVLGYEFEMRLGDPLDQIANYVFASAPGHPLWRDIFEDLIENPPRSQIYVDVCGMTGPGLLSRIFFKNFHTYPGVVVEPRRVFSPYRVRGKYAEHLLLNNGATVGVHHAFGSWKERWTPTYFKSKLAKWKRKLSA